eukprot:gene11313-14461_t
MSLLEEMKAKAQARLQKLSATVESSTSCEAPNTEIVQGNPGGGSNLPNPPIQSAEETRTSELNLVEMHRGTALPAESNENVGSTGIEKTSTLATSGRVSPALGTESLPYSVEGDVWEPAVPSLQRALSRPPPQPEVLPLSIDTSAPLEDASSIQPPSSASQGLTAKGFLMAAKKKRALTRGLSPRGGPSSPLEFPSRSASAPELHDLGEEQNDNKPSGNRPIPRASSLNAGKGGSLLDELKRKARERMERVSSDSLSQAMSLGDDSPCTVDGE